jgi:integrase/recombinase XerD
MQRELTLIPLTKKRRKAHLNHLLNFLENEHKSGASEPKLDTEAMVAFYAWMKRRRNASSFWLHNHRVSFHQFFEWMAKRHPGSVDKAFLGPKGFAALAGVLPPNPRIYVRRPKADLDFWKEPVEFYQNRIIHGNRYGFILARDSKRLARLLGLLPRYLLQMSEEGVLTAASQYRYRRELVRFFGYLQDIRNLDLGAENIDKRIALDYLSWLKNEKRNGPSAVANAGLAIKSFFNWLLDERLVRVDPMAKLPVPRAPRRFPRPLEPKDINALLSLPDLGTFVGRRDRALFEIMYGSGLRISEALGMKFQNLELSLSGDGPCVGVVGKGGRPRFVPLTKASVKALRSYLEFRGTGQKDQYVFTKATGVRLTTWSFHARMKRYQAKVSSKLPVTCHRLRHSFASHLYANGAPIEVVSRLLGHAKLTTTEIYAEVTRKHIFDAYRKASFRERLFEESQKSSGARPTKQG